MQTKKRKRYQRKRKSKQQRDLDRRIDKFFYEVGPAWFWVQEHDFQQAQQGMIQAYICLDALDGNGTDPHTTKRTKPAVGTADLELTVEQRIVRVVDELMRAQDWALRQAFTRTRTHMLEATIELDALMGAQTSERKE